MEKQYVIVDDIEIATHWIPEEDLRWTNVCNFTPGNPYKMVTRKTHYDDFVDEDYWVKDNDDIWHMPFAIHKGYFVKGLDS